MRSLSTKDFGVLEKALNYMIMEELKETCESLGIPSSGKKGEIILRILHFVNSGKILTSKNIPAASKAQKGVNYPLKPNTLILSGSYKNDLNTRLFMQKLVGEHFHFTAFGQDWIKEQWFAETPPTYKEFASFWQKEHEARKKSVAKPKKEWAYLNFTQSYLAKAPHAAREEIINAWGKERRLQVRIAKALLKQFLKKSRHLISSQLQK